jgi:hypothetical protein
MTNTQRLGELCWWHLIKLDAGTQEWRRGRLLTWSSSWLYDHESEQYAQFPVGIVEDIATGEVRSHPVELIRFCDEKPEVKP